MGTLDTIATAISIPKKRLRTIQRLEAILRKTMINMDQLLPKD
jgi:hypothetical protein